MTTEDCDVAVILGKLIMVLAVLALIWIFLINGGADERASGPQQGHLEHPALPGTPLVADCSDGCVWPAERPASAGRSGMRFIA